MQRYVRFYYDGNGDLVAITAPGLSGDLQMMRFYYASQTLISLSRTSLPASLVVCRQAARPMFFNTSISPPAVMEPARILAISLTTLLTE